MRGGARATNAKERVKAELKRGKQQGGAKGGAKANEHKDREKRKLLSQTKREVAGTSGW